MKACSLFLIALALTACDHPEFALGATISSDGGVRPSVAASDGNVSVVVRP